MENLIVSFEEAISLSRCEKNHRSVLLGNGFSIAAHPQFDYQHLYDGLQLTANLQAMFSFLDTYDFELVISGFERMMSRPEEYGGSSDLISWAKDSIKNLRKEFFCAITQNHPLKSHVFNASHGLTFAVRTCRKFMSHFSKSFTTNYDLLLYWQIMEQKNCDDEEIPSDDGFTCNEGSDLVWLEPYQHISTRKQNVFYLHGSLFFKRKDCLLLKERGLGSLKKILKKSIIDEGQLPLSVLEGSSRSKLKKIIEDNYLKNAYEALKQLTGDLFIFGHSLSLCDAHIVYAIMQSDVENLFISIHGNKDNHSLIMERAQSILKNKNVYFFDADSAQVWIPPTVFYQNARYYEPASLHLK